MNLSHKKRHMFRSVAILIIVLAPMATKLKVLPKKKT